MNDFLLVGNGVHTERYRDALLFADSEYKIHVANNLCEDKLTCTNLIICEPFFLEKHNTRILPEPIKTIILEKLPFRTPLAFFHWLSINREERVRVIHTRLYEKPVFDALHFPKDCTILWPNLYESNMDPFAHTLPNVIDWVCNQLGCTPNQISIESVVFNTDRLNVELSVFTKRIRITLFPGKPGDRAIVNGVPLKWPNYIDLYHNALFSSPKKRTETLPYTIEEIEIIRKIEENTRYEN